MMTGGMPCLRRHPCPQGRPKKDIPDARDPPCPIAPFHERCTKGEPSAVHQLSRLLIMTVERDSPDYTADIPHGVVESSHDASLARVGDLTRQKWAGAKGPGGTESDDETAAAG